VLVPVGNESAEWRIGEALIFMINRTCSL